MLGSIPATAGPHTYTLPLSTVAGRVNPPKDLGSDAYVSMEVPASVAIYELDQFIHFQLDDRTGLATFATWEVNIYHAGKSAEDVSFNIPDVLPTGAVVDHAPDLVLASGAIDPDDDFLVAQEDLAPGYNTLEVTVTLQDTFVPPPSPSLFPSLFLSLGDDAPGDVVAVTTLSYLIFKAFDAEDAAVIPAPLVATVSNPAVLVPLAVSAVSESAPAVVSPNPVTAEQFVYAVALEPILKG